MYVARYLGAEGFGILSFALAFTAIFGVITDFGLNQLATREIARNNSLTPKYLGNVATLKIILGAIAFGLIALTINLMHYPEQTKTIVYLTALFIVFNAFCVTFYAIFQAHERMEFVTLGRVLNAIMLLAGGIFAVVLHMSLPAFALVYFVTSSITLAFDIAISIWKFEKPRLEIDLAFWKRTLTEAWPFGLSTVFTSIYFWIGSVMLSVMKGDEVVGWFNAAYRLVFSLAIVPTVYFTAVFPVMSKYYVTSRDSLIIINERSMKYMLILAIPIAVGTSLLADKLIRIIFGSGYENSIIALQLLVWAVAFVFVSSGFARLFESSNRQMLVTSVAAGCALLNVLLNLVLIPKFSYIGASVTTIVTEFTALAVLSIWSSRIGYGLPPKQTTITLATTIGAGLVLGIFVFLLRNLTLWVLVPISSLLYFGVLFIIKGIDAQDIRLLKQVIVKK